MSCGEPSRFSAIFAGFHCFRDHGMHGRAIAHVEHADFERRPLFFRQLRCFVEFGFQYVASDHTRAEVGEIQRDAAAEAMRCSGYNCSSTVKTNLHRMRRRSESLPSQI